MSEDPNGRLPGDADEPREPFDLRVIVLGHCEALGVEVTDEECLDHFASMFSRNLRALGGFRRMECVRANVTAPESGIKITAADLNALPEGSVRAILGNVVMVAQTIDRTSPAGRTLISEVRLHMSRLPVEVLPI